MEASGELALVCGGDSRHISMEAVAANSHLHKEGGHARTLRVLLDARKIQDGGIGVYIQNLIAGLLEQGGIELTLIVRERDLAEYPWSDRVAVIVDKAASYSLDELFFLGRRIDFSEFDLYHSPHYTLPFGISIPTVVTIHDTIHVHHPERSFYPFIARRLIRSAMKRATRVVAVSQATFDDLEQLNRRDRSLSSKMRVLPNAIDPYFALHMGGALQSAGYVSSRFGLRGQYLLAVFSNAKPHKAIEHLISAYNQVRALHVRHGARVQHRGGIAGNCSAGSELKLVLVGGGTEKMVQLEGLLNAAGDCGGVHLLGNVSREDLLQLYARAAALVVPSLAEGFCLPVLEAHALGVPVIARPVPAVLELLTDGDVLCKDLSIAALRDAIEEFVDRPADERPRVDVEANQKLLRKFSAAEVGRAMLAVYREAFEEEARRP